jgi:3-hydroxybutyryl-CoA dehydrogenase
MMDIRTIAVIGPGRMGRGIALTFAYAGLPVVVCDLKLRTAKQSEKLFAEAKAEIADNLNLLAKLGMISGEDETQIIDRIGFVPREAAADALRGVKMIFEGVPERMEAKLDAFTFLNQHAEREAIIASTTSTFSVNALGEMVDQPQRFINAHWLNPAHLLPLIEVSRGDATSEATVETLTNLLREIGKVPVICAATAGYIVPRIQALAMNEAARMVEDGVASPEDIDTAIKVGFGVRYAVLGMLEFIDWGGGDILYYASNYLAKELGERHAPADVVVDNMHNQRNGLRDGVGFYDYKDVDINAYREKRMSEFAGMLKHLELLPKLNRFSKEKE